jgi:large subunit ribosomal protein L7/L12
MQTITKEQVLDFISGMKVKELVGFISELEQKFGVKAADLQPSLPHPGFTNVGDVPPEEQTEFDVLLIGYGDETNRIPVIKALRAATGLTLKEAKTLTEDLPNKVREGISEEGANEIKAALEKEGAIVSVE